MFLCDIFPIMKDIDFAIYVDDNTSYTKGDNFDHVIEELESDTVRLF